MPPKTTVRAKFHCNSVNHNEYNRNVNLTAICGKEGENADFTKATPVGELNISISNDVPASDFFVPGQNYYLDFTQVQ